MEVDSDSCKMPGQCGVHVAINAAGTVLFIAKQDTRRTQQLLSFGNCESSLRFTQLSVSLLDFLVFSDILREFNANLTGYSTGTGGPNEPNSFLNQALPGAQAE